jgi:H+-transporting ATPase
MISRREFDDDDDEEEDEDIDALIDELESQDGENADYEEEEADQPGGARVIPEELLQTDTRLGLNSADVLYRRKKFGYNQMKGTWTWFVEPSIADMQCRGKR